jgi:hypothetical protein
MLKDALVLARIVLMDIRAGKQVRIKNLDVALANIKVALQSTKRKRGAK